MNKWWKITEESLSARRCGPRQKENKSIAFSLHTAMSSWNLLIIVSRCQSRLWITVISIDIVTSEGFLEECREIQLMFFSHRLSSCASITTNKRRKNDLFYTCFHCSDHNVVEGHCHIRWCQYWLELPRNACKMFIPKTCNKDFHMHHQQQQHAHAKKRRRGDQRETLT